MMRLTRLLIPILVLAGVCCRAQTANDAASTRAFWTVTAIDYAATFADAAVSARAGFRPGVSSCHETNPIYGGRFPSGRRVWLQMAVTTSGIAALSYGLKRKHKPWFVLLPSVDAMVHAVSTAQTARYCF